MRIRTVIFITFLSFFTTLVKGQEKYWVFFTDKNGVAFNPYDYYSSQTIDRKLKQGIDINDETNKPVSTEYVDKISVYCDSVSYSTRWFNGIAVYSDESRMEKIRNFSFVRSIEPMEPLIPVFTLADRLESREGLAKLALGQIKRMQGELFRNNSLTGKGIRIAIIDGGFTGLAENAFERLKYFNDINIVASYDFIGKSENVFRKNQHGKTVVGCIAGKTDSSYLGLAPEASFLLARTAKNFSEGTRDEEYWLAAVEWCDKNGAQIINTSLGYDVTHYFQKDMDGKTSLISRSANLAAKKGILVVVSAGNEGQNYWKKICTPADADSVLTVGAINPYSGIQASWSSYGPSADFRIKPEVSAYGNVAGIYEDNLNEMMGTSFASPLVAGFAACVMQLHPDWNCMKVKDEIMRSADLYPYYDYAHGYGVPQAGYFFNAADPVFPTFTIDKDSSGKSISIILEESCYRYNVPFIANYHYINDIQKEKMEYGDSLEAAIPSLHIYDGDMSMYSSTLFTTMPDYLFYHVENENGYLDNYYVIAIENKKVITIKVSDFKKGTKFMFYFRGYTKTYEVK